MMEVELGPWKWRLPLIAAPRFGEEGSVGILFSRFAEWVK
jgi:hypothetical protein